MRQLGDVLLNASKREGNFSGALLTSIESLNGSGASAEVEVAAAF